MVHFTCLCNKYIYTNIYQSQISNSLDEERPSEGINSLFIILLTVGPNTTIHALVSEQEKQVRHNQVQVMEIGNIMSCFDISARTL